MAGILNTSGFNFDGTTIRAISELAYEKIIQDPLFSRIHTIYPGIVAKTQMGFTGEGGLVGVKNQGCDPTPQDWGIATRTVEFNPVAWEILIRECWTNLESSAIAYSLKTGIDRPDFTNTDYAALLQEVLIRAMLKFQYRLTWFNSVDAANVADGGEVTDGVDVKYFNILDGLFHQMDQWVATHADQHISIAENTGASYANQKITPDAALDYLQSVYDQAGPVLTSQSDKMLLVTGGIFNAYRRSLQNVGALETTYKNQVDGMETLTFNGIPVIPMYVWDELLKAYFNTGTKIVQPNRILLTTPEVLGVAMDAAGAFDVANMWYEKSTREVNMEAMGMQDVQLMHPELFVYGS